MAKAHSNRPAQSVPAPAESFIEEYYLKIGAAMEKRPVTDYHFAWQDSGDTMITYQWHPHANPDMMRIRILGHDYRMFQIQQNIQKVRETLGLTPYIIYRMGTYQG